MHIKRDTRHEVTHASTHVHTHKRAYTYTYMSVTDKSAHRLRESKVM